MALPSRTTEEYNERSESGELKPYYIEAVEIASAKDVSGQDLEYHFTQDTAIMLELEIGKDFQPEVMIGGNFAIDWDNASPGAGEKPRKKPLEWGSNFKVDELAARAGCTPLFYQNRDDNVIRDEVLQGLIGQTIVYMRYCYGQKSSSDDLGFKAHDRVRFPRNFQEDAQKYLSKTGEEVTRESVRDKAIELAKQSLEDAFLDEVDSGYVDEYSPEAVEAAKNGGNSDGINAGGDGYAGDGAPSSTQPAPAGGGWDDEDETFEPDDELPF